MPDAHEITIPAHLLPADGRFGSGPSKIRPAQVDALAGPAAALLGTSHRQAPVRALVGRVRAGLAALLDLPDGYEVVLGNGGSTALLGRRHALPRSRTGAAFGTFGEFGAKFAAAATRAPFVGEPVVTSAAPGGVAVPALADGVDTYAWPHNETSTGVVAPVRRVAGSREQGALVLVDGTSGAGGLAVDVAQTDVYYFAPQKSFASDGGLWLAAASPAAIERAARDRVERPLGPGVPVVHHGGDQLAARPDAEHPGHRDPGPAGGAARLDPRQRRPGVGGAAHRDLGRATCTAGPSRGTGRRRSSTDPALRSAVVGTIDLDPEIEAATVARVLRAHGVVDVEPYRKLGRNQLRVAMYPAVEPDDVLALTACVDHVVDQLV